MDLVDKIVLKDFYRPTMYINKQLLVDSLTSLFPDNKVPDCSSPTGIHPASRLVEYHCLGVADERQGDTESSLHTA